MPFVKVNGIKHHYIQKGHGADLVLIHGMGGNMSFWIVNKALAYLKEHFRVTVYDLRGHGYSDFVETGYTSRDLATDLKELMNAIGIESAYLAGHSLGGQIAIHTTALYPEKVSGLIMAEGNVPSLRYLIDIDNWVYRKQREEMLRKINPNLPEMLKGFDMYFLEYMLKNGDKEDYGEAINFGIRKGHKVKTKGLLRLLDHSTIKTDVRDIAGLTEERVGTIEHPTLALYGEFSPLIPICNHLSDNLVNCTRVVIPEACHLFPARLPEEFARNVREYLLSVERGDCIEYLREAV